jgi:hypothetical protein
MLSCCESTRFRTLFVPSDEGRGEEEQLFSAIRSNKLTLWKSIRACQERASGKIASEGT